MYLSASDAIEVLGELDEIRELFFGFQKHFYGNAVKGY
jgi:hypothetical protein